MRRYRDKAGIKSYTININPLTEPSLYARMEQQPAKAAYIKDLIRKDIAENP